MIPICSPTKASVPTSLALGSFDGLHKGHKGVIEKINRDKNAIPTVVSFWPHPREVLYGESRLRIDLPSEKNFLLEPLGIKQLVLIPFDRDLASLSPEKFFQNMLINTLQAKHIAVGENFRFGCKREGSAITLKKLAEKEGIKVTVVPIISDDQGRMSSSRIRHAVTKGNLEVAKDLMGRAYRFQGIVKRGKGIGRQLGWPTANLSVDGRKFLPGPAVYSCVVWIKNNPTPYPSVMNLGPQPTIDPESPSAVEVHLLDKYVELNGTELIVEPVKKIREQKRFANLDELSSQIALDADLAREMLAQYR